jgi:hypothetical protein
MTNGSDVKLGIVAPPRAEIGTKIHSIHGLIFVFARLIVLIPEFRSLLTEWMEWMAEITLLVDSD